MFDNLNLTKKGLLLVSVPIVVQLLLLSALFPLLKEAESTVSAVSRTQAIIYEDLLVQGNLYRVMQDATQLRFTRDYDSFIENCTLARDRLDRASQRMELLTEGYPEEKEKLHQLQAQFKLFKEQFGELQSSVRANTMQDKVASIRMLGRFLKIFQNTIIDLKEFTAIQERSLPALLSKRAEALQTMNLLFGMGLAANVLITALLAVAFHEGIGERLRILIANVDKIAKKQSLLAQMRGKDEFARLDRTFHSLAENISAAEQRKASYLTMVNHDLRAPLTSLIATLHMISRGKYGEIDEKGRAFFASKEREMERLIQVISDVLDSEKYRVGRPEIRAEKIAVNELWNAAVEELSQQAPTYPVKLELDAAKADGDSELLTALCAGLLKGLYELIPRPKEILVTSKLQNNRIYNTVTGLDTTVPPHLSDILLDKGKRYSGGGEINRELIAMGMWRDFSFLKRLAEINGASLSCKAGANTFSFQLDLRGEACE